MMEGANSAAQTMPQEQETTGRHTARRNKGKGGLARSSLLMAVGTVVSRATGLIRQVLQAAALGFGPAGQYVQHGEHRAHVACTRC